MYGIGTYGVNSTPCIVEFIVYISFKIKMIMKILISIKCENIHLLFTEKLSLFILIKNLLPPSYKFNGVYLELD